MLRTSFDIIYLLSQINICKNCPVTYILISIVLYTAYIKLFNKYTAKHHRCNTRLVLKR